MRFVRFTEKDGWSHVKDLQGELPSELWRYDWEAQERADELNRRYGLPPQQGGGAA